ncbi:division plane positioning ATPase MipZ [Aeoliella sp. SH292]|uniref:division plane positioning ATPase MipZ n=1 Tax=Aeoliella sp. SH292 TaxID=3454464 RepID=UPI003F95B371
MMIVFANSKGGVGKSTLAVHCAAWLYDRGFKTALLDADKQRSSSVWMCEVEPQVTVRTANTAEECAVSAQELLRSHDFVIGDAPGGLEDLSRTLLILSDLAIFPISPSILDVRSVLTATDVLRYAQTIRNGLPEGRLVLNKMKTRGRISTQLRDEAPKLGLKVAHNVIRSLEIFCDAPQQGTVVTRLRHKASRAADELNALFNELLGDHLEKYSQTTGGKELHG